jgi:hypothetical protein
MQAKKTITEEPVATVESLNHSRELVGKERTLEPHTYSPPNADCRPFTTWAKAMIHQISFYFHIPYVSKQEENVGYHHILFLCFINFFYKGKKGADNLIIDLKYACGRKLWKR